LINSFDENWFVVGGGDEGTSEDDGWGGNGPGSLGHNGRARYDSHQAGYSCDSQADNHGKLPIGQQL